MAGRRRARRRSSCMAAVFAPWLAAVPLRRAGTRTLGAGAEAAHPLGVDPLARDILSRILFGARVSLQVALAATASRCCSASSAGALAGYFGRWTDEALMRIADAFSAFPGILLAVAITAAFEKRSLAGGVRRAGAGRVEQAWRASSAARYCHCARRSSSRRRARWARHVRILLRHILPNCLAPVIVTATLLMAGNILGEAGLSFLGIGVQPPYPVLGRHARRGARGDDLHWWMCVFPGLPSPDRPRLQPARRRPARRARSEAARADVALPVSVPRSRPSTHSGLVVCTDAVGPSAQTVAERGQSFLTNPRIHAPLLPSAARRVRLRAWGRVFRGPVTGGANGF